MSFPWKTSLASVLIAGGAALFSRNQFNARICTPSDYSSSMSAFEDAEIMLREEFARDPCMSASPLLMALDRVKPAYRSSYFDQVVETLEKIAPHGEAPQAHRDCPLEFLAQTYVEARLNDARAYAENEEYERRDGRAKGGIMGLVIGLSALAFGMNSVQSYFKDRSKGIPG